MLLRDFENFTGRVYFLRRDRELLSDYFKFLSSMEYNMHQTQIQQRLLDELVDITVNVSS